MLTERREQLKALENAEKSYERVPMSIDNRPFEEPSLPESLSGHHRERQDDLRPQPLPYMPPGSALQEDPYRPGTYQGYMRDPPASSQDPQ